MKKKGGKKMNAIAARPKTPAESLKESLNQMKQIREGKRPRKTWKQLREESNREE